MRVMCDTNVLVRAAMTPGGAASVLLRLIAVDHLLVTSVSQLAELLDVLRRPRIRALHGLNERGIRRFISRLYKLAVVVPVPIEIPSVVPRDPKDNAIVMAAVAGEAEVLRTLDRHLHHSDAVQYCARHGVRVLRDADLLVELRSG